MKISKKSEKLIIDWVSPLIKNCDNNRHFFDKMRLIDEIVSRKRAKVPDGKSDDEQDENKDFYNFTVPLIQSEVATHAAAHVKIFLSQTPIFPVGAAPEAQEAALQYNALQQKYADNYGWRRNLILALHNGSKYNLMAVEAKWKQNSRYELLSQIEGGVRKTKQIIDEGFAIKNIDLSNLYYDPSVRPADVPRDGEYCGYLERHSKVALRRYLDNLPIDENYQYRIKDIIDSKSAVTFYKKNSATVESRSYMHRFINGNSAAPNNYDYYDLLIFYCRIIPSDFGLSVPDANEVQLWEFSIVNFEFIVHARRRSNIHDLLPIIIGQPLEDEFGSATESLPERLQDLQDIASSLVRADLASANRSVNDRALFNPTMIAKEHLQTKNPSSKIPVRHLSVNQGFGLAYQPIPFSDPASGTRLAAATQIMGLAQKISGQNSVDNGAFVKGNRTDGQFNSVMEGSNSRAASSAFLCEDQFFSPIKSLLSSDMIQYQTNVTITDRNTGKQVKVDPLYMQSSNADFVITDGLIDLDQRLNSQEYIATLQLLMSNPMYEKLYDLAGLTSYVFELKGLKHVSKFERKNLPVSTDLPQPETEQPAQSDQRPEGDILPDVSGIDPVSSQPAV